MKRFFAVYENDGDGWISVYIKGYPVESQGMTIQDARDCIIEALSIRLGFKVSQSRVLDDLSRLKDPK